MVVEYKTKVKISDVSQNNKITNRALISYLEEVACNHSNIAGYGLLDIPKTKMSWIILNWKIKLLKRPMYTDEIIIKTWSRKIEKIYAYRDFEIFNSDGVKIGIASSKWALVDIDTGKIARLTDELIEKYTIEEKCVFETEFEKLIEPENAEFITNYKINRSVIDVNNHVNNIYYMDIANEALPFEVFEKNDFNQIEIMYKREIKLGENVKLFLKKEKDEYVVIIKSEDENTIHSIVKFK